MIIALIAFSTVGTAFAQGPAPPASVSQIETYEHPAHAVIQATWPTEYPLSQPVLSQVRASATPPAGAGATVGRGGGAGPMTGRRDGMGPMAGPGHGMKARPHEGFRGPGPGNEKGRGQANRGRDHREHFRRFNNGYSPWGYMQQYPGEGYYSYPYSYSFFGGYYYDPYRDYYPNFPNYNTTYPWYYYYPNYGY